MFTVMQHIAHMAMHSRQLQDSSSYFQTLLVIAAKRTLSLSYHLVIDHLCFPVQTLLAACKVTILHCDLYTLVPVALNMGAIKSKLACCLLKWFHDNNVKKLRPGLLKGLATANLITPDRTTSKMRLCICPCLTTLLSLVKRLFESSLWIDPPWCYREITRAPSQPDFD